MQPSIIEMIHHHREEIKKRWKHEMKKIYTDNQRLSFNENINNETDDQFGELIIETVELNEEKANQAFRPFAEKLIQSGWPLSYFTQGLQAFRRVLFEVITGDMHMIESKAVMDTVDEVDAWIDRLINQLVDEYSGSWEDTFNLQKMALKELSAPLIPVFEQISVMPLIGTIDTERSKLIMENLLNGIIEHRSEVVLIDITGVPVVDTMVAHHIIQAAEAVRLVGAECILVGIRPEIAQTIVNLGIDLSKFVTKSSLQRGVEMGLEMTKRKIVST